MYRTCEFSITMGFCCTPLADEQVTSRQRVMDAVFIIVSILV
jgi:hypothetical protein